MPYNLIIFTYFILFEKMNKLEIITIDFTKPIIHKSILLFSIEV